MIAMTLIVREKNIMNENWCGTYKLDENRNAIPCSTIEWGEQHEQMRRDCTKHVADETIDDKRISTVWLGLDHQWNENGPPLIYETMVFNGDPHEIYCKRYSTWQEAEKGHHRAVQWVKNGCQEDE